MSFENDITEIKKLTEEGFGGDTGIDADFNKDTSVHFEEGDMAVDKEGNEYSVKGVGNIGLSLTNLKTGNDIEIDWNIADMMDLRKKI